MSKSNSYKFLSVSGNAQMEIDALYKELRIQKKKLKPVVTLSLWGKFRQKGLKKRLEIYIGKLEQIQRRDFSVSSKQSLSEIIKQQDQKLQLIKQRQYVEGIIVLLNEQIRFFERKNALRIKILESGLKQIENGTDNTRLELHSLEDYISSMGVLEAETKIQFIRKVLERIRPIRFTIRRIDFRESYRTIVKMRFKNMDDQSGDDSKMLLINLKRLFLLSQNHIHKLWTQPNNQKSYEKYMIPIAN